MGEEVPPASESEKGSPSNRLAQLAACPRRKFSQNSVLKVRMLSFFCDIRNENAANLVFFSKTTSFSIFN